MRNPNARVASIDRHRVNDEQVLRVPSRQVGLQLKGSDSGVVPGVSKLMPKHIGLQNNLARTRQSMNGHYRSCSMDKFGQSWGGSPLVDPSHRSAFHDTRRLMPIISPVSMSRGEIRQQESKRREQAPQALTYDRRLDGVFEAYLTRLSSLREQARLLHDEIYQWESGLEAWEEWLESKMTYQEEESPSSKASQLPIPPPMTSSMRSTTDVTSKVRGPRPSSVSRGRGCRDQVGGEASVYAGDRSDFKGSSRTSFKETRDVSGENEWITGLDSQFSYSQPDPVVSSTKNQQSNYKKDCSVRPNLISSSSGDSHMRQFHLDQAKRLLLQEGGLSTGEDDNGSDNMDGTMRLKKRSGGGNLPKEDLSERAKIFSNPKGGLPLKNESETIPSGGAESAFGIQVSSGTRVPSTLDCCWDDRTGSSQQDYDDADELEKSEREEADKENRVQTNREGVDGGGATGKDITSRSSKSDQKGHARKQITIPPLGLNPSRIPSSAWLSGGCTQGDTYEP